MQCVKILFFSVLDQPTYHWGHHVIFGGASVDFFDLPNNQWSPQGPTALPALAAAEHLDEVLFVFKSNIYLLLYSHFGQLYPYSLHQFVPEERRWRSIVHFASAAGKAAEGFIFYKFKVPENLHTYSFHGTIIWEYSISRPFRSKNIHNYLWNKF